AQNCVIEPAVAETIVKPPPEPRAGNRAGQREEKQAPQIQIDQTGQALEYQREDQNRKVIGLQDGAPGVSAPAAQASPNGRQRPRQSREAAHYSPAETDHGIGDAPAPFQLEAQLADE